MSLAKPREQAAICPTLAKFLERVSALQDSGSYPVRYSARHVEHVRFSRKHPLAKIAEEILREVAECPHGIVGARCDDCYAKGLGEESEATHEQ